MKKLLLAAFSLVFALSVTNINAQCTPDPIYDMAPAGVYPLPDTVGSPTSSLPTGYVGTPYTGVFTAVVPDSLTIELTPGSLTTLDLVSVTVTNITGLPPGADTYACDVMDCIFPDQANGCLAITGTPTTVGTYFPIVEADVNVGATLQVTFPGALVDGEYKIFIEEEFINTNNIAEVVGLGQNVPNPFSTFTQIDVDSKEAGQYDFKVYSLIGEMVHAERVNLLTGNNTIQFDATNLNSGVYFYTVGQGNSVVTKRMVVSK